MKSHYILYLLATLAFLPRAIVNNTEFRLSIRGVVTEHGLNSESAVVKAFDANELIWKCTTGAEGVFSLEIPNNKYVTLSVEKTGHNPEYIIFDTRSEFISDNLYSYNCQIDLIHESELNETKNFKSDFPVGIVQYDAGINEFSKNDIFTSEMKQKNTYHLKNGTIIQSTKMSATSEMNEK